MATQILNLGSAANGRVQIDVEYDDVTLEVSALLLKNTTSNTALPVCTIHTLTPTTGTCTAGTKSQPVVGLVLVSSKDEQGHQVVSLPAVCEISVPFAGNMTADVAAADVVMGA